jgi:tetratricopeptide (TPR) repeat protein
VLVFFAGHGATRKLPSGRDLGYIVPVEADTQNFQGQSISMSNFQDISESIPAKHVFFVMDSCYSGLAITRGQSTGNYIKEMSRRTARQMLTAGGADEEVADNGPNGHSVFTWTLLQGLEGRADLNADGFISAAELAAYAGPGVSALSHQTPAFGNLPGSEGGEFIFELHPETEFLSGLSTQLDQEAIQLNAELDRVRREIAAKTARNEQLRAQLAVAKSQLGVPKEKETTASHLNKGDSLFRERRYEEALKEFQAAAKLDPKSAVAANNVGWAWNKLGNIQEAIRWTEMATTIDPNRAVAFVNLADLYYQLNRTEDARVNYEKYLQLAPNSSYAPTARARLGKP